MVALVVLAVPPILTNAYVAVDGVDPDVVEAARGMGMRRTQVLWQVELPLALPLIFAGIRTAAVYVVATATLAAIAGGGGLGDIIVNQASYRCPGRPRRRYCVAALALLADVRARRASSGLSARAGSAPARASSPTWPRAALGQGLRKVQSAAGPSQGPGKEGEVIRKHTRRPSRPPSASRSASRIVLGGLAAGARAAPAAQPTVKLGTKNFTEEYILGQLYKQALEAKGFKVAYHENIGSTEIIDKALTSGQINVYPEYLGTLLSVIFHKTSVPKNPAAALAQAKALDEKRGFTLFTPTPFFDTDAMGVLNATAKKYSLKTIARHQEDPGLSICGSPEFQTRYAGLLGLKQAYGITKVEVRAAGRHLRLRGDGRKKCIVGDVFSTDPQLARPSKYTVLDRPEGDLQRAVADGRAGREHEARQGARLEVPPGDGRRLGEADAARDDRDEQGGRDRQEVAGRRSPRRS